MEQKYLYFGNVGNKYVFMISLIYAASQSQEFKRSSENCDKVWLGLKLFLICLSAVIQILDVVLSPKIEEIQSIQSLSM